MSHNNFSIISNTPEKKLDLIVNEILKYKNDILIGYACNTLNDVLYLYKRLLEHGFTIRTVFIPSSERLNIRLLEAKKDADMHGRWLDTSSGEIQSNFDKLHGVISEIKKYLITCSINVIEV